MTEALHREGVSEAETTAFYDAVKDSHCSPLWTLLGGLPPVPTSNLVPHLWRYADIKPLLEQAGAVVPLEEATRRVLGFRNPGSLPSQRTGATDSLWAALQLVLPGEFAPPHRHTPNALRFIVEGTGAYTVVNGQRAPMNVGDFLLTPGGMWHEHGKDESSGPMIWLDGLDSPLMSRLNQYFLEEPAVEEPQKEMAPQPAAYWNGMLTKAYGDEFDGDVFAHPDEVHQPLLYPYADARAALDYLREEEGDPFDDIIVEYRNPKTAGPVMTTISAYLQLVRPGTDTRSHRHTHSTVYHVVEGSGFSIVDGQRIEWTKGDTLAIPLWYAHSHHNHADEDAVLFSYTDKPAIEALGLWRTEEEKN